MTLGVDIDPACAYPYEHNNRTRFLLKSVEDLTPVEIQWKFRGSRFSLLAGCAPCQPFSKYRIGKSDQSDSRWYLLREFQRLVLAVSPTLVSMENVPRLSEQAVFRRFVAALGKHGYQVWWKIVNCADYGVPQTRERLVLLASRLGPISLIEPTHSPDNYRTVRRAIGRLSAIKAGEVHRRDRLHRSCILSLLNLKRIRASRPGGTWRDWSRKLVADCHKKKSGKTYPSVYGRMTWDEPAPTITTQFFGFGNGRFGHPEQNRAISLREGAILQTFPSDYRFVHPQSRISHKSVGRLIGNAVPVRLGEAIGRSVIAHIESHATRHNKRL